MMLKRWQIAVQGHETGTIVPLDFATFWSRHGAARWVCANPSDFIDLTSYTVVRRAKKNGPRSGTLTWSRAPKPGDRMARIGSHLPA